MANPLRAPAKLFASLRLTVVLLGFAMALVLFATFAQVELGIHEVQRLYLRSWIAWVDLLPGHLSFKLPFPGGMLLGTLLLANLLAAHARRFKLSWNKAGLIAVHTGVAMLLLSELFTALLSDELQMRLDEGQRSNYSAHPREVELAIIDKMAPGEEEVTAIPLSLLEDEAEFELADFTVRIDRFFRNSDFKPEDEAGADYDPMRADRGLGVGIAVREEPRETAMNRRDLTSAFVEISDPEGRRLGRWLLSNALGEEQSFEIDGETRHMVIRQRRMYHPFSLQLLDFTHERYLGTEIPKNFSSRVLLDNPETGEKRETLIYMNHPLRYAGLTFYQSGFDNDDTTSILQVVRNPVWTLPYIACTMVALGLLWIFLQHLIKAVARNRKSPQK